MSPASSGGRHHSPTKKRCALSENCIGTMPSKVEERCLQKTLSFLRTCRIQISRMDWKAGRCIQQRMEASRRNGFHDTVESRGASWVWVDHPIQNISATHFSG